MCVKWILDKMGQFRTYNDISLSNRLVRAQQDLTELKASQKYFMNSVKGFEVPYSQNYNLVNATHDGTWYGSYGLMAILTFVGDKPSKNVWYYPSFKVYSSSGVEIDLNSPSTSNTYCMNYAVWRGEESNIVKGFVNVRCDNPDVGRPYIKFGGVSNDNGVLSVNAWSSYVDG